MIRRNCPSLLFLCPPIPCSSRLRRLIMAHSFPLSLDWCFLKNLCRLCMKWGVPGYFHWHSKPFMFPFEIPGSSFALCFSIYKFLCWISGIFICILHFAFQGLQDDVGILLEWFFCFFSRPEDTLYLGYLLVFHQILLCFLAFLVLPIWGAALLWSWTGTCYHIPFKSL